MKQLLLFLSILVILLVGGCNLPSDSFGDDDEEWDEPDSEVYNTESDDETADESSSDEETPRLDNDALLLREFSFALPLFSTDSAWNQRADGAAVLAQSDEQILSLFRVLLGDISTLGGYDEPATDWPFIDISLYDYTVPIFRAGDDIQDVWICQDDGIVGWAHPKFGIDTEGGPVTVPAPAGAVRPAGPENDDADGWMVLYDPDTFISYDYFAATPNLDPECRGFEGGLVGEKILQAGVVDFFDVRGPGVNPDTYYSARAVGTPLLAGLILPEDIKSGVIAHALSFAIPGPRNLSSDPYTPFSSDYFYPATTTETDFFNTDPNAIASGQRIRLKQTLVDEDGQVIDEEQLAPITRMFLQALRDYGAYLVDNSGGFTFYAEDVHTAVLNLSDDEVNALIGEPPGTPLPEGMTKWQIVIERLGEDLGMIPLAVSPGDEEPDPKTALVEFANFEVVEPAEIP